MTFIFSNYNVETLLSYHRQAVIESRESAFCDQLTGLFKTTGSLALFAITCVSIVFLSHGISLASIGGAIALVGAIGGSASFVLLNRHFYIASRKLYGFKEEEPNPFEILGATFLPLFDGKDKVHLTERNFCEQIEWVNQRNSKYSAGYKIEADCQSLYDELLNRQST